MSHLSMMEARLPPGFRFHPRDDELICDYLAKKVKGEAGNGGEHGYSMIVDVDLNKCEPWDLPEMACVGGKEWYFFSLRDRKYATGCRTNRATESGYWKATGKDQMVNRKGVLVGTRKTLVFYKGRAPKGTKTDWVMHEFRIEDSSDPSKFYFKDWALCKVSFKSRSTIAKIDIDNCQDETSRSTFLPLKDTDITFDQITHGLNGCEQVPCFSNLSGSLATPPTALTNVGPFDKKDHPLDSNQRNLESYLRDNSASYLCINSVIL